MKRINKKYYENFYDIFKELGSYTFFLSALDGLVDGILYADSDTSPSYAVMLTADLNYITGNINSGEFAEGILEVTKSDTFPSHSGFIFESSKVDKVKEIFIDQTYAFVKRYNYQINKDDLVRMSPNFGDLKLVKATSENIKSLSHLKNYQDFYEETLHYWNEYPNHSRIRFANVLVNEGDIASYCYICGESISENSAELGIESFEGYQRNGYAEKLCRITAEELFDLDFDLLNWHCHASNIGSNKTAQKLGFKKVEETHLAWFKKIVKE